MLPLSYYGDIMVKLLKMYRDFSGGLSEVANDNMQDNELVTAKNIIPGDGYGISRTYGTDIAFKQIPYDGRVLLVIELRTYLNQTYGLQILAFVENEQNKEYIFIWNESTLEWEQMMDGDSPKSIDKIKSWYIYANKLYWLDGTNLWQYDGAAIIEAPISASGSEPSGFDELRSKIKQSTAAVIRNLRCYYIYGNDQFIVSEISAPTTFLITNVFTVNTQNNDYLTAIYEFNDGLLLFKKRSVHFLSGDDFATGSGISLKQLNVTSGTEWPETIKIVENAILYLGMNGVYRLSVSTISNNIQAKNISDKKVSNTLYNNGKITGARAGIWDNIYHLSVDNVINGSVVNREYRYYVAMDAFYGEYTQGVYSYMPALQGEDRLYIGSDNGYILYYSSDSYHYIDVATGNQTKIPIDARTKGMDVVGAMFQDAKVKKVFLSVKQYITEKSGLIMQIKADYADAAYATEISSVEQVLDSAKLYTMNFDESLIYSEGSWGFEKWGWLETVTKEISIGRKCKRLQFIFTGELAEPLLIYGIGILYKKKKVKGNREGVTSSDILYVEE